MEYSRTKYYTYNDRKHTANSLAKLRDCSSAHMRELLNRYGVEKAMTVELTAAAGRNHAVLSEIPKDMEIDETRFDDTLERKRSRLNWMKHYGMSLEDIAVKERML